MRMVQSIELMKEGCSGDKKGSEKDSFFGSLVTRLINNVQITIEDIQIEFRDEDGKQFPYHLKVHLEQFKIFTTNVNWMDHFEADIKQSIYKLLVINSFSVVMTNNGIEKYILEPIHATGKLSLHKNFNTEIPKTNLDIYFENIDLNLDNFQIGSLLELAASFAILQKKRKFCKNLPVATIQQEPQAWLR